MGCGESKEEDEEHRERNREVERDLKRNKEQQRNEIKILLLGIGESGKSTIAKQMRILYLQGFPEEERRQFIPVIHGNIMSSIKILSFAYSQLGLEQFEKQEHLELLRMYQQIEAYRTPVTSEHAAQISVLWRHPAIQAVYNQSSEYFLPGCVDYFLNSLERIATEDYLPSPEDILRCRAKTTTIIETCFSHDETHFRMVDVGGQRSERRKWIHCFQDVTAMLYVTAISEYDQRLLEDGSVYRLCESLELFEELVNSVWFRNQAIIIFLNKVDLFKKKLPKSPLNRLFPNYTHGGADPDAAITFLADEFRSKNKIPGRSFFIHPTTATDTDNIRFVFQSVKDTLLERALSILPL